MSVKGREEILNLCLLMARLLSRFFQSMATVTPQGAETFRIMALSIVTLSIVTISIVTLSIVTLNRSHNKKKIIQGIT